MTFCHAKDPNFSSVGFCWRSHNLRSFNAQNAHRSCFAHTTTHSRERRALEIASSAVVLVSIRHHAEAHSYGCPSKRRLVCANCMTDFKKRRHFQYVSVWTYGSVSCGKKCEKRGLITVDFYRIGTTIAIILWQTTATASTIDLSSTFREGTHPFGL